MNKNSCWKKKNLITDTYLHVTSCQIAVKDEVKSLLCLDLELPVKYLACMDQSRTGFLGISSTGGLTMRRRVGGAPNKQTLE